MVHMRTAESGCQNTLTFLRLLPSACGAAYIQVTGAYGLLRNQEKEPEWHKEEPNMKAEMKELSLDEMQQVNGGWLFTIAYIVTVGAILTAMPYIADAIKGE